MGYQYIINPDQYVEGDRTICEVLRELYRDARERNDFQARERIQEAYDMAKRMDRKLREYKAKQARKHENNLAGI